MQPGRARLGLATYWRQWPGGFAGFCSLGWCSLVLSNPGGRERGGSPALGGRLAPDPCLGDESGPA